MSFSSEVKEELSKHIGSSRHCQLAEIAAILYGSGRVRQSENGEITVYLQDDNSPVIRKFFTLLKKAFNIVTSILEDVPDYKKNGRIYRPVLINRDEVASVLGSIRVLEGNGTIRPLDEGINPMVTKNSCCKRAFLMASPKW